jgi:hypothetical protein
MAIVTCSLSSMSQEGLSKFSAGGYASWLHMAMFEKLSDPWISSSMLHNRLNFRAYPGTRTTIALELRNRFVTGDMVSMDPSYRTALASDHGFFDLSWNIFSETSFVLNTMIDRAWIEFTAGKLQLTAGRQRINWSQALVWNPNDIFNTYSFFDFDYIERPGSDAIRAVYSTDPASAAEAVVKLNDENKITAAALYRFSILNTDLQFLAGVTDEELLNAGTGWSGTIGSYSIRGEATLFYPFESSSLKESTVIVTAGIDRVFSDKLTALTQVMYSNKPVQINDFNDLYEGGLTARELAFSEFSAIGQVTYSPVSLLSLSLAAIWFPDMKGYFVDTTVDYSLAENVDFSFLWQHFDNIISGERTLINLGFIRIKYNF